MNIFLKVFLCLFYFVIQTSLTNLSAMNLKKLKTKLTVHIFFLKTPHFLRKGKVGQLRKKKRLLCCSIYIIASKKH